MVHPKSTRHKRGKVCSAIHVPLDELVLNLQEPKLTCQSAYRKEMGTDRPAIGFGTTLQECHPCTTRSHHNLSHVRRQTRLAVLAQGLLMLELVLEWAQVWVWASAWVLAPLSGLETVEVPVSAAMLSSMLVLALEVLVCPVVSALASAAPELLPQPPAG